MSVLRRWRQGCVAILCIGLCGSFGGQTGRPRFSLAGTVTGGSGRHTIRVALWDQAGFLTKPVEEMRIPPGSAPDFHFDVPAGRWALSAFEDENENGRLEMGRFGPKEPSGFWRPFHGWRRPRFDDVAVSVGHSVAGAEIRLHR